MNWLFDSPVTIGILGAGAAFFLGVAWVQTGRNAFMYSISGVIAAVIVLISMSLMVESDGEKVRSLIYDIAADVQSNDEERLAQHIVSGRPELAEKARTEMRNYQFTDVTIGTVHRIVEQPEKQPPVVVIDFNVSVSGSFGGSQGMSGEGVQRWVRLTFWKDNDGQWRIADYQHDEATAFMRHSDD